MNQTAKRKGRTEPLAEPLREAARRHLAEIGEVAAASDLGVSRIALARSLAGLDIRLTVATTIKANLERLALIERVSRI